MTLDTPLAFDLPAVHAKKLTVDFDGGNQSSDAGLLLLREAERRTGVIRRLAEAFPDRRDPARIDHGMEELLGSRIFAIACGYEDANDLDRLRHDPALKLSVGRSPETGEALASQSTISRLENAPTKREAVRLTAALVDQFGTAVRPRREEILDIDDSFYVARRGGATLRVDAASSSRSGTRTTTSAALARCMSCTWRAARRSRSSCARRRRRQAARSRP
jgi:hypothetical protein